MLFHNPVVLAIIFASLVIFSQGRCIAGFGISGSKDEFKFPMGHLIIREIGHMNMLRN
jgi:alkanesulfonate monooxygenase SsuD/methylene tetrahydromethanopterin reductase-like flavin-dependent oxidoreductase (luciferase family)